MHIVLIQCNVGVKEQIVCNSTTIHVHVQYMYMCDTVADANRGICDLLSENPLFSHIA